MKQEKLLFALTAQELSNYQAYINIEDYFTLEPQHKCNICPFQTIHKSNLKIHAVNVHQNLKNKRK